jgi:hypothetical protein
MIDLAAERARSLARQEERFAPERMRARARRVLELNWSATEDEMREKIAYEWPNMDRADTDELLVATLEVQRTERRTITPDPETTMPRSQYDQEEREQIRALVRDRFQADSQLTVATVHEAALAEFPGLTTVSASGFYQTYVLPVKKELGIANGNGARPKKAPEEARAKKPASDSSTSIEAPKQEATAADDAELSGIVHETPPESAENGPPPSGRAAQTLSEENRSLRATYESGDYMRLEDHDGEWRLMVSLSFGSRFDAAAALAALAGATAGSQAA